MNRITPLSSIENLHNGSNTSGALKAADSFQLSTPLKGMNLNDQHKYKQLLTRGKAAAAEGELRLSLVAYQEAYRMRPTEKIWKRIEKIKVFMEEIEEEGEEDFIKLNNGLIIYRELIERLYPHQISGITWMYDLNKQKKKGGILADDMGLGKTIQIISFLSAAFDMDIVSNALLVMPLSLIPNWEQEFGKWAPGIAVKRYYGRDRAKVLDYCQRKPSICLTTYGLAQTQWEALGTTKSRQEFVWDYVILDEGHKIKNPTKTTKALHAIPSRNRLLLTGTPIQNNLRELWALFDWVTQGCLLGTQKTFKSEYEIPITRARERGASAAEIHLGNYMSESLRKIIEPYLLRRTKKEVSSTQKMNDGKVVESQNEDVGLQSQPSFPKLKTKNDFVIWTYLSPIQEEIYRNFINQDSVKQLLTTTKSPLVDLTVLKKICDHPRLLSRSACQQLGFGADDPLHEDDFDTEVGKECAANRIDHILDETLIEESGKLKFLFGLLDRLETEGHRTLIFSQSRKILNIIQKILINRKVKVMRMDGTITKLQDRELRVKKFQEDSSYSVFLLTTQVGGVGLTLTAADRVVIYDPSWNPATDAQAVDRIYRIGQEKNVVVYRLITCGTVEEKIYRRQIFKDSIIKQSTGDNKDPYRYFTKGELKELFEFHDCTSSMTQRQLQSLHSEQRDLRADVVEHLAYIHVLHMFGVSDHDLMFSQEPDDVEKEIFDSDKDVIHSKVEQARSKIEVEASAFTGKERAEDRWGAFDTKPKEISPRLKETEPTYPVEGLYEKFNEMTFNLPDIGAYEIKNEIDSDNHSTSTREANEPICISDEEPDKVADEIKEDKKDEVISLLIPDSPEKTEPDRSDIDVKEIDESIYIDFSLSENLTEVPTTDPDTERFNVQDLSSGDWKELESNRENSSLSSSNAQPDGLSISLSSEKSQSSSITSISDPKQTCSDDEIMTDLDEEMLVQSDWEGLNYSLEKSNISNAESLGLNIFKSPAQPSPDKLISDPTHNTTDEDMMTDSDEELLVQHDSVKSDRKELIASPKKSNPGTSNREQNGLSPENLEEYPMQDMPNSPPVLGMLHLSGISDLEDEELSSELEDERETESAEVTILSEEEQESKDQNNDSIGLEETELDSDIGISLLSEPSPMTERLALSRARSLDNLYESDTESPLNYAEVRKRKNKRRSTALPAVISSDECSGDETTV